MSSPLNTDWQPADSRFFTGEAQLQMVAAQPELSVANVRFASGCRNYWHTHPISQTLVVTEGLGLYQEEGKDAIVLRPGVTVHVGAGVKHWHGACTDFPMSHVAITLNHPEHGNVDWLEPVSEETYLAANQQLTQGGADLSEVTAGRDQLGGFADLFAELNDDVLFGKVWQRTDQLCPMNRSIVTVCTLMATGITDSSLLFHLEKAKSNGVSKALISEIITHAAFYMGWPKAWAVFNLAKQVWCDDD